MTTTEILTGIKDWVLSKLSLKQDVINDLAAIRSGSQAGSTAVQPSDLSSYFNDASYDTSTHRINFYHGQNIVAYVDASPFIVDGMVDDVRIESGYLVIDFNTASGKQDISIPLTDIFDPSNYYNKTQTNTLLGNKVDKVSGKGLSTNDYTNSEKEKLSGLQNYDDTQVRQLITQTNANFANYYTKEESYSTAEVDEALGGKQNTIDDLANIRSGAQAGSTAVQPSTLNNVVKNTIAEAGVYDVTAHNNNAKFASLSALLSSENLNTLIPSDIRKGGMSIKFVLSSDNKYVQFGFMLSEFTAAQFTDTNNWQGVDDEPIIGSKNLVKSGGVYKFFSRGAFDASNPPFSDADVYTEQGSYFIGKSVTQNVCANLPKYGVSCLFSVNCSRWGQFYCVSQSCLYQDGESYLRYIYIYNGSVSNITTWNKMVGSMMNPMVSNGIITSSNLPPVNDANIYNVAGTVTVDSSITQVLFANMPKYGMQCVLSVLLTATSSTTLSMVQIASYVDGSCFIRIISGTKSAPENVTSWQEIPKKSEIFADRHSFDTSSPQFDDINKYNICGVMWLGSNITPQMCANLPKYGYAGLLEVETAHFSGSFMGCSQTIYYVDGSIYRRLLYGTSSNPTATAWKLFNRKYIVCSDGAGDYTNLIDAVSAVNDGDTIIVYPGTYDGTIRLFTKRVNIIGIDKNTCIIRSTDGRYNYPAMEATTGCFKNLTFKSQYIQGVSNEIGSTEIGAYAVHCEGSMDNDFSVGKSISFTNCRFESDFFPAFGCGAVTNWKIEFINCEFISNQPSQRGKYTDVGGLGALYFHDQAGAQKGHSEAVFRNCVLRTTVLSNTICLYDLGGSDNDVVLQFINNTIYSKIVGFSNSIWWRGVTTPFGNILKLDEISNGNTETELNNN